MTIRRNARREGHVNLIEEASTTPPFDHAVSGYEVTIVERYRDMEDLARFEAHEADCRCRRCRLFEVDHGSR